MKAISSIALSLVFSALAPAQTAEEIMTSVRQVTVLQKQQTLNGVIRKKSKKTPLTLFLRGENIQFMIDGGKDGFHLRLKDSSAELWDITNGKAKRFPARKISTPVVNTDLSYEDLALKFLYWKNPRIVGSQLVKGQDCWRIHVANPERSGNYREVSVWVTKKHRALAKVVGYGPRPAAMPLKQFEITDVMKVNGVFTVEKMKVNRYNEKRQVVGTTHLEFSQRRGR